MLFGNPILGARKVYADETASWTDIAHINYNGNLLFDKNPYDSNPEYIDVQHSDCGDRIVAYGLVTTGNDGSKATIFHDKYSQLGKNCVKDSKGTPLTIQQAEKAKIGAYKIDDNSYYVVVALKCTDNDDGAGVLYKKWDSGDAGYGSLEDWRKGAFFKPSGGGLEKDQFLRDDGGGNGNINNWDCGLSNNTRSIGLDYSGAPAYAKDAQGNLKTIDSGGAGAPPPSCQTSNPLDFAWWACGMLGVVDSALEGVTNALSSLLSVTAEDFSQPPGGDQLYKVWSYFRAVASFLLIGVALVMIIGQAIGSD